MKKIRGFTLVELIIAFALLMIVIAVSGAVLLSTTNIFTRQTDSASAQTMGNGICDYFSDKLKYAVDAKITYSNAKTEDDLSYNQAIYVKNSKICLTEVSESSSQFVSTSGYNSETDDMYGDEYYSGFVPMVMLTPHDNNLIDVCVEIYKLDDDGGRESDPTFRKTKTITMLNVAESVGTLTATQNVTFSSGEGVTLYIFLNN